MAQYQNQYGAVPLSNYPIQKEIIVETTVVDDGTGRTHVIANDEYDRKEKQMEEEQHHQQKKGMIEKIKEKLHGTHHQNHNHNHKYS